MHRGRTKSPMKKNTFITSVYQAIDFSAAILILTGQITSTGVFVSPSGFWLSLTGPILGGTRLQGSNFASTAVLDAVDVVAALLLIMGQLTVTGPWITSGSFNLVITGPAFGVLRVPVPVTESKPPSEFCEQFRQIVVTKFLTPE